MFGKLSSKTWAILFFLLCLILSGTVAFFIAKDNCTEIVYVARERIRDAPATIPMEQQSLSLALKIGIPIFLGGALLSAALTELYYFALEHFKKD